MERRRFLTYAAATPALLWVGCKGPAKKHKETLSKAGLAPRKCRVKRRQTGPGKVLGASEWRALEAVTERLYPADQTPGAKAANVVNFIDDQLSREPVKSFERVVKSTMRFLDRQAKRQGGTEFSALSTDLQDKLLGAMQKRRVGPYAGGRILTILLTLTLEGLFADPIYGGNQDQVSWKGIGFVPQLPAPRCPYRGPRGRRRT